MKESSIRDELVDQMDYNPETGEFFWKNPKSNRVKSGAKAGCLNHYGYVVIGFKGRLWQASHLAWIYMRGEVPEEVDHENRTPSDNRFENLRKCSRSENQSNRGTQSNNTSGVKGVYWHKQNKKWCARITKKRKTLTIGCFSSIEDAKQAYALASIEIHREYSCLEDVGEKVGHV